MADQPRQTQASGNPSRRLALNVGPNQSRAADQLLIRDRLAMLVENERPNVTRKSHPVDAAFALGWTAVMWKLLLQSRSTF